MMDIYEYKGWKFGVSRMRGWRVQIRRPSQEAKNLILDDLDFPESDEGKKEVVNETRRAIDHLITIGQQLR